MKPSVPPLRDGISHQAIVFFLIFDVNQPTPIQNTLSNCILPVVFYLRENRKGTCDLTEKR